uniref:Uncharacterized protein n=1 Tax=Arundo donax TaxID=35708 RepID=A0A0A9GHP9_ARUDO
MSAIVFMACSRLPALHRPLIRELYVQAFSSRPLLLISCNSSLAA